MRIVLDRVALAAPGIWVAKVDPYQLLRLAKAPSQIGQRHIVVLSGARYEAESGTLEFDVGAATVLNVGKSNEGIFLADSPVAARATADDDEGPVHVNTGEDIKNNTSGDAFFLEQLSGLPASVRVVGQSLLGDVRAEYRGELRFHPASKKFVETPDNFWVVRIQPRDESLRIVIYGRPSAHQAYPNIEIAADMGSYSTFKISRRDQLPSAIAAIKAAHRLKHRLS